MTWRTTIIIRNNSGDCQGIMRFTSRRKTIDLAEGVKVK